MKRLSILCFFLMVTGLAFGQSASIINYPTRVDGGLTAIHTAQLWVGQKAKVRLDGDWHVFSRRVYIHPKAHIFGDGDIILENPDAAVFSLGDQPTLLDGNQSRVDVRIILKNKNNLILHEIDPATTDLDWPDSLSANHNLYIGKELIFAQDDAHVIANDADVVVATDATLSGYSEDRYVVTSDTGGVIKEGLGHTPFVFPVGFEEGTGVATDYTPARLLNNGIADDYAVRVHLYVTDFPASSEGVNREWVIREKEPGGSYVELTLQHNQNTEGARYASTDAHFITQYAGEAPNELGGNKSSTTWDYALYACDEDSPDGGLTDGAPIADASELSRVGLTDFYDHTRFTKAVCEKSVLEDIWKIFTADVVACETQISWVVRQKYLTADYFVVERSYDGVQFLPITTIYATPSNEFYNYFDPVAPNGKVYYRVKMVDKDGDAEYSPVDVVESNCGANVASVYPNPFYDYTTIVMNTLDGHFDVIVYDEIGQPVDVPVEMDQNLIHIDGTKLRDANYYVLVLDGDRFFTVELTKLSE